MPYERKGFGLEQATSRGKQRVAEALWAAVARDGVAGVSVRSVAAEAGVTGGTVQYHFPTRTEMLRYAMELIAQRVEERLIAMPRSGPAHEWTRALLLELLPLDRQRHHEFSVWLAFFAHASTDPSLARLKRQTASRQRELYRHIIRARTGADADPRRPSGTDGPDEPAAALLHAVIDGLALQLADLDVAEAAVVGPALLDHYLAHCVDSPQSPGPL